MFFYDFRCGLLDCGLCSFAFAAATAALMLKVVGSDGGDV